MHEGRAVAPEENLAGIESSKVLDDETRRRIDRDNTLALFPRLAR